MQEREIKSHGFITKAEDCNYTKDEKDYKRLFSYNFTKMMKKHGLNSSVIARKLDTPNTVVRRWRRGAMPRAEHFSYLCLLFDCDIKDFFERE